MHSAQIREGSDITLGKTITDITCFMLYAVIKTIPSSHDMGTRLSEAHAGAL